MSDRQRGITPRHVVAAAFVALGLLANPYLLGAVLSPDGVIERALFLYVIVAGEIALIAFGLLLAFAPRILLSRGVMNGSVAVAALLLSLACAESGLRLLGMGELKETAEKSVLIEDPRAPGAYRLAANLDVHFSLEGLPIRVVTNSRGMHWREVDPEGKGALPRIAFLGDSFAFGQWVDDVRHSFVGVFDSLSGGPRLEVLNFGVVGYGYQDIRRQLELDVLQFRPDYVVVASFNGNDLRDTWLGDERYRILDGQAVADPEVISARVPDEYRRPVEPQSSWQLLARASRIFGMIELVRRSRLAAEREPDGDMTPSADFFSYAFWSQTDYPDIANRAVEMARAELARIKAITDSSGARLLLVTIPFEAQVYAPHISGDDWDVRLPQLHLEQWAAEHRVPYLDLLPPLRDSARASPERLYWASDPHFNMRGHRLAGQIISAWFEEAIRRTPPGH